MYCTSIIIIYALKVNIDPSSLILALWVFELLTFSTPILQHGWSWFHRYFDTPPQLFHHIQKMTISWSYTCVKWKYGENSEKCKRGVSKYVQNLASHDVLHEHNGVFDTQCIAAIYFAAYKIFCSKVFCMHICRIWFAFALFRLLDNKILIQKLIVILRNFLIVTVFAVNVCMHISILKL